MSKSNTTDKSDKNDQSNKTDDNNIYFNFYPNIADNFDVPLTIFKNWDKISYNDNIFYINNDNITIIKPGKYNISHIITSTFSLICKITQFNSYVVVIRQGKENIISNIVYWDVNYGKSQYNNLDTIIDLSKSIPQQSNEDNPPNVEYDLLEEDIIQIKFKMKLYACEQIVIGGTLPVMCNIILKL
jgi:hypothetical protein